MNVAKINIGVNVHEHQQLGTQEKMSIGDEGCRNEHWSKWLENSRFQGNEGKTLVFKARSENSGGVEPPFSFFYSGFLSWAEIRKRNGWKDGSV